MENLISLGHRIIELRNKNNISREQLARRLNIPYTTLRNYENGLREPGHIFLINIAEIFNVSTDYLLGLSNFPNSVSKNTDSLKDKLIHNYDGLNQIGKDKLVDYSEDLLNNPNYKSFQTYNIKIAARNGQFEEKALTDSDIQKIMDLPDVTEDDLK